MALSTFYLDNKITGGCMQAIYQSRCVELVTQSRVGKLLIRVIPLLTSLWMYVDMGLDVNQTITYYQFAFQENGSYHLWALKYRNETNSTYLQSVSSTYFYAAAAIWIGPPFLVSFFYLCNDTDNIDNYQYIFVKCLKFDFKERRACKILAFFICLPIATAVSAFASYLFYPIFAIYVSFRIAWAGKDYDDDVKEDAIEQVAFVKMTESVGEAVPQFILSLVFIANNYPYLLENDVYFGVHVPLSCISCIFSFGSMIMGLMNGFALFKHAWDDT